MTFPDRSGYDRESSRELYQRLLRGEVPASAYTDAVKRKVAARRPMATKHRRPWWRFWR